MILVSGARGKSGFHVMNRLLKKGFPLREFAQRSVVDGGEMQI